MANLFCVRNARIDHCTEWKFTSDVTFEILNVNKLVGSVDVRNICIAMSWCTIILFKRRRGSQAALLTQRLRSIALGCCKQKAGRLLVSKPSTYFYS